MGDRWGNGGGTVGDRWGTSGGTVGDRPVGDRWNASRPDRYRFFYEAGPEKDYRYRSALPKTPPGGAVKLCPVLFALHSYAIYFLFLYIYTKHVHC